MKKVIMLLLFIFVPSFYVYSEQAEQSASQSGEPVVVAPGKLTKKEQARLQKEYTYEVRHKEKILSPYAGAAITDTETAGPVLTEATEEEKLYRYFGVATSLREEGKLEEAIEILEYILYIDPTDEYVRNYLKRVKKELKHKDYKWRRRAERDASLIKKEKIKYLTSEGKAYYRQKQYDMALVRFNDILTLDPNNSTAEMYIKKLKRHYRKELRVEDIVQGWQEEGDVGKERSKEAKVLDEGEWEELINERETSAVLEQAEMELVINEIITQQKIEERRARYYQLGPGDVVEVSVRDHPELSGTARVGVKGEMVLPLTNDIVRAADLTVDELMLGVTDAMQRYIDDPNVYITIVEYNSKMFYVVDEGGVTPYTITRANFTLRDALFASDWGWNRALGRVEVIKPSLGDPIVKKVNAFDIVYKGDLTGNIQIEDGDVIYVPMTMAGKTAQTISDALAPVAQFNRARDMWMNLKWSQKGWGGIARMPERFTEAEEERARGYGTWGGGNYYGGWHDRR